MLSHAPAHHLSKNQRIIHYSVWYGLIATIVLISIIAVHYHVYLSSESLRRSDHEVLNLGTGRTGIITELSNIQSDVNFLARQGELHHYFDNLDTATREVLARDFVLFSNQKNIYDQIRIIDIEGQETIRINNQGGQAVIVGDNQLQNKAERYYFQKTLKLEENEIYISPFDLNIERDVIEIPIKPVIRFGTPLFDSSGNKVGVLILNYLGERLLGGFRNATAAIAEHAMLLSHNGYWLSHFNRDQEWGFMLDHQHSFSTDFPQEWQSISSGQSGQFETDNGIFTFATIYPGREITGIHNIIDSARLNPEYYFHYWKLVSHISVRELNDLASSFLQDNLLLYLPIFIVFLAGTHIIARLQAHHQVAEIEVEFERHFRMVLESIEIKVLAVDLNGNITFCNNALIDLLGRERDQLIGNNWVDEIVANHCKSSCIHFFNQLVEGEQNPGTHESWLAGQSGNEYLLRWHDTSMVDSENKMVGLIFMGEDITRHRENEERINLLSEALEQSPASVIVTNNKGKIEYVNPKFERLTGYTLDDVKGLNPRILKSGHTSNDDYSDLWEKVKEGKTWRGIFHNRKKNGALYWESASISGIRNPEGKITHFLAVKEDITEQKMLEERFKHCFNAAPVAMIMSDSTGKIIIANDKLQNLFGFLEKDLLGKDMQLVIPHEAMGGYSTQLGEKSNPKTETIPTLIGDFTATKKSGDSFPVQIGTTCTPTHEGIMTISAIIDLSARQKLEKELFQRNEEISHNQAVNTIGKMASMIAHDLRNPLSSIKMGLQIFQKQSMSTSQENASELNQIALEQVYYMEDILNDLMSYSRPDALNLEWVDIEKIIEHSIGIVQKEIDSSCASINTWFEKGLPIINADSRKMRQIISNLLTNAIQSVESLESVSPEINITAQLELGDEDSYIKITIQDNGCGIDKKNADSLFEPFYTSRTKGTGLGLAIAKRFIELQEGIIYLQPTENGSTSAIIKLKIDLGIKQPTLQSVN